MKIDSNIANNSYYSQPSVDVNSRTDSIDKVTPEVANDKNAISDIQKQNPEQKQNFESKNGNEHDVIQAIEKANKHIKMYDRRLEFSIHDLTKQIMVKVINTDTDKVIKEIPSEKILDMVAHLWEVAGILVDEKI